MIESRMQCGLAHPGLCQTANADMFAQWMQILQNMEKHSMNDYGKGDYVQLIRMPAFGSPVFVRIGYIRLSTPRDVVAMVAALVDEGDKRRLHIPRSTKSSRGVSMAVRPKMLSSIIADALKDCSYFAQGCAMHCSIFAQSRRFCRVA